MKAASWQPARTRSIRAGNSSISADMGSSGGAVGEYQRLAAHSPAQDREIRTEARDVGGREGGDRVHHAACLFHHCFTASSMACRAGSLATASKASARKARTRIARASDSGMPRVRR